MTISYLNLEEQYRSTRAALVAAGLDMSGTIDALYRDWRRWREKPKPLAPFDSVTIRNADQWWARHIAQFQRLIDPVHVTARAVRARKDRGGVAGGNAPTVRANDRRTNDVNHSLDTQ